MNQWLVLIAMGIMGSLLQSCGTARAHHESKAQQTGMVRKGTGFTASAWRPASGIILKNPWKERKLPSAYEVYTIDPAVIKAFFESFKDQPDLLLPFEIPLPESTGLQTFTTKDAGILSAPLREKYPDLYNLSGTTTTNLAHIRLNYDGQYMSGMITYQNKTFLLTSWEATNGSIYYLLYNKNNTNETKTPFENGEKLIQVNE